MGANTLWFVEFIILIVTLWVTLYFYFTRKFNHWKKKNVDFIKPMPFFGNAFKLFTFKENFGEFSRNIYESTTKPFIGFFVCDEPYLLIRDPELIKTILVKDFAKFSNRSIADNHRDDPIGSNILFILKNPVWRELRKKITPVFSSGKMKMMYPLIQESAQQMVSFIRKELVKSNIIEIKEISAKFTTDAITSTSFGINANCFKFEDSEFRQISRRVFNWAIWERVIATSCYFVAPNLTKFFKLRFVDKASTEFLRQIFWKIMEEREKENYVRNDLLDILGELRKEESEDDTVRLEGDVVVAQAVQFFIAGFETTSTTITFTLYELAANKEIQTKLREEIKNIMQRFGELSHDALQQMEYLDLVIKESVRKYPVLPFLDRRCEVDYQIPGTDIVLEKGQPILIANWAMHYDETYFPDPDKFDPERFTEENQKTRLPFTYMPFGEGPRHCIGARFGTVTSKTGVASIISEFEVDLCDETGHPLKLDTKGILLAPTGGLLLKLTKI